MRGGAIILRRGCKFYAVNLCFLTENRKFASENRKFALR